MTIDIRADVSCSLGPVISGNIGDDYIQGVGLIKTTGSVTINDLITPAIGTIVTFSYTKSGITRSIPRKLRVKSSFADPFRRTTQVELGCKLDYLSDLKDRLTWDAFDDPENSDLVEDDARIITIPIHASSVMNKCLAELGISASGNPLTNKFSIAEFDYSSGYVSILNDLLVSESYCGYLDTNEVLQVFALDQNAGTGPVITADDIIDLSPIGAGKLPGEAVTVSYSTLKLKAPEPEPLNPGEQTEYNNTIDRINWERSETIGPVESYYINTKQGGNTIITRTFTGITVTVTETKYEIISYYNEDNRRVQKEVPSIRKTTTTGPSISKLTGLATQYYEKGQGNFNNVNLILNYKEETYLYDDLGNEVQVESITYEPEAMILASAQFDWVYEGQNFVASYELMASEYTLQTKEYSGEYSRVINSQYVKWPLTQPGNQSISITKELLGLDTIADAIAVAQSILNSGLVHDRTTEAIERTGAETSQTRPSVAERTNSNYAKGGDPNNGWRTESVADLELAVGSATAQRRIELSMAYAPDDIFMGPSGGPFTAVASDAPAKANRYGRVQNRLLLGNRNGISIQLAAEKLPSAPYSPIYIQANGLTALYRANGTNWAFDSNGIIASIDALFWAAVGGTGVFWFPVAPGITTLPAEPPVVDGTMNASSTILPYNETAIYNGIVRTRLDIVKFNYALELLTVTPAIRLRTTVIIDTIVTVYNTAAIGLSALPSGESGSLAIPVDGSDIAVNGLTLLNTGDENTVYPQTSIITLEALGIPVLYDSIIFTFDGADGSTSISASSSGEPGTPPTATVFGTAALDTSNSKFGTASLHLDGPQGASGDWIEYEVPQAFGLNNFCIEFWIYTPSSAQTDTYSTVYTFGNANGLDIDYGLGTYYLYLNGTGTSGPVPEPPIAFDQWQHIAIYRIGGIFYVAADGVVSAGHTITCLIDDLTHVIGTWNDGETTATGYVVGNAWIDEVRVTFGNAVYGPSNFTPPTGPF